MKSASSTSMGVSVGSSSTVAMEGSAVMEVGIAGGVGRMGVVETWVLGSLGVAEGSSLSGSSSESRGGSGSFEGASMVFGGGGDGVVFFNDFFLGRVWGWIARTGQGWWCVI